MSGYRRKEKELTQEEAIAQAKKELKPYWFGSPPLVAAVKTQQKATLHPLEPSFLEGNWLIFLVDMSTFLGEDALKVALEFFARFSNYDVKTLFVLCPRFSFLADKDRVTNFYEKTVFAKFPVVIDYDGAFQAAFPAKKLPDIFAIEKGKSSFVLGDLTQLKKFQHKIHDLVRRDDPGLPLRLFYELKKVTHEAEGLDFIKGTKTKYVPLSNLVKSQIPEEPTVFTNGKWAQMADHLATDDNEATLTIPIHAKKVSLLLGSATTTGAEITKIIIDIPEITAIDDHSGPDLKTDRGPKPFIEVPNARLYHALVDLPESDLFMTLRFPTASRSQCRVFGVRFCN